MKHPLAKFLIFLVPAVLLALLLPLLKGGFEKMPLPVAEDTESKGACRALCSMEYLNIKIFMVKKFFI